MGQTRLSTRRRPSGETDHGVEASHHLLASGLRELEGPLQLRSVGRVSGCIAIEGIRTAHHFLLEQDQSSASILMEDLGALGITSSGKPARVQAGRDVLQQDGQNEDVGRMLVFTQTKHKAERVMRWLTAEGIAADSIHSNKNQRERQRALDAFDRGRIRVLVATDIVARGIDVDGISHVVNYELPQDPENYVHRIGRTARAGADGTALSFCAFQEVAALEAIEKLTKTELTLVEDHPYPSPLTSLLRTNKPATRTSPRRRYRPRRRGR